MGRGRRLTRENQIQDEEEESTTRDEWSRGDPTEPDLIYFQEFTKRNKKIENIVYILSMLMTMLTFLFGIYNGYTKSISNFINGCALLALSLITSQLRRWYRQTELPSKYRFVILFMTGILWVLNITAIAPVFQINPQYRIGQCPRTLLPSGSGVLGLYRGVDGTCWAECVPGFCMQMGNGPPGMCLPCPR